MPLDIQLFRADQGGDPDRVRESQKRRFQPVGVVNEIIEWDNRQRAARGKLNVANKEARQISIQVGNINKAAVMFCVVYICTKLGEISQEISFATHEF